MSPQAQFLQRSGQKIVNQSGQEIILRGMGLGGWMLQEPYMMEMSDFASAQWQIKEKIKALIGESNTNQFYIAWHANHCTKKDIDSLAAWGFNSVRLPMHYNLFTLPIESEPIPGNQTWLNEGFALTDSLIKWCSAHQMYVILDLHAAPGGQGKDYAICDGNPAKLSLWESDANKQKTIALWRKLAERYANEPYVGGYDILNEPNWSFTPGGNQNGCSENTNGPLRQLMINITNAIRQVDNKHIIIIEGNCWGNNYNGIFPVWDENIVVSFHKYWSYNDIGSIQSMLNIRSQQNIPLWMGESGENSNSWFTDAIRLAENNKIGWAWWPLKKINSVVGPMTIIKTPEYQTLLDYWSGNGAMPAPEFAKYTLMQMASNAKAEYCISHKDVIDAMFRQINDSATKPFKNQSLPGVIHASDYDLGRCGKAWFDTDIATYQVSSGSYTDWNSGHAYRNDGVDIEKTTDTHNLSNGYNVGWTADHEWLQFTVNVDSTAVYNLLIRYSGQSISKIKLSVNGADIIPIHTLSQTGSNSVWKTDTLKDVILYKGEQKLRFYFVKGGSNLGFLKFSLSKPTTSVPLSAIGAETIGNSEQIGISFNKLLVNSSISSSGFTCTVNGTMAGITNLSQSGNYNAMLVFSLDRRILFSDTILISHSGGGILATDGTVLEDFQNLLVTNNLPLYFSVPGKIEAEDFSANSGIQLETCTDIGGGKDVGYTDAGDYMDYRINVIKSSNYSMELRIASWNTSGTLQVLQMNETGSILNSATVSIPVTGGWQTWGSIFSDITLTKGATKLRLKVEKSGFNLNWFRFIDKSQGINDQKMNDLIIYPNPAKNEVTISSGKSIPYWNSVKFFNINGTEMKKLNNSGNENPFVAFVGDLPKGFYVVEAMGAGIVLKSKLIIN